MKNNVHRAAVDRSRADVSAASPLADHREVILKAGMILLARGGRDALTTRAVAAAARVQPPILYRLFKDKAGLLNAVAEYGFGVYMEKKRQPASTEDPVESLRAGWRLHIEFGLTHFELYLLMYADPHPGMAGQAADRAYGMLRDHMRRIAAAGRLRVHEDRAAHLFHAIACGTVMTLLGMPDTERDLSLSEVACEAALAAILAEAPILPAPSIATASTTLRVLVTRKEEADVSASKVFTDAEHVLLVEWLNRLGKPYTS